MPERKRLIDLGDFDVADILGAARVPGEALGIAALTFGTRWLEYEMMVLQVNPDLALAGRERVEAFLDRVDEAFQRIGKKDES